MPEKFIFGQRARIDFFNFIFALGNEAKTKTPTK
jgi:hypothetical protein